MSARFRLEPSLAACRLVLLVAFPAVDRPSLSRLEWDLGLGSTVGALRWMHLTGLVAPISASSVVHTITCFANFHTPLSMCMLLQFIIGYKITPIVPIDKRNQQCLSVVAALPGMNALQWSVRYFDKIYMVNSSSILR
jgi:hypothetical protein